MANDPSIRFYKYKIDAFDILLPDVKEPIKIDPSHVSGMSIENDFDNNYFPIFKISLSLSPKVYHNILKNKLSVKFRIRVQKYVFKRESEFDFKEDYINSVFCIYIDANTPFLNEKMYDDITNNESTMSDYLSEYVLYLFKEKDVNDTKVVSNKILTSTNMTNAIAYLLSSYGFKDILMAPLDNTNEYDEVVIQPITLLGNLEYLEQQFGFYNEGAIIFFDFNTIYVVPKISACKAWRKNGYKKTIINVKDSSNVSSLGPGCYDDAEAKQFFINITPNNYNTDNQSILTDHMDGNAMLVINPISGTVDAIDSGATQRGPGSYKILVNKNNNKISTSTEKHAIDESSVIVSINISDFDMKAVTPNKEFLFVFENKKINVEFGGLYRMSRQFVEFVKQGDEYQLIGNCQLRKPPV